MDLEKTLLRKVGEAIHRFNMIRDGDRIAVAVSGGKDSVTLLEALLLLQKRAPIDFSVCAFTVEQGKFLRPVEPIGEYIRSLGVDWTYHTDNPSLRLLTEQPDHGCDLCSRFRRRAVYQIARGMGANVIAFGHTADDFCESLFRNIMFTGRLSSLPPVTYSRERDFRLIRPLVYVTEEITRALGRKQRRAGRALRLFAAHRHRPPQHSRDHRRLGNRAPAPARKHPLRHGQHPARPTCSTPAISTPKRPTLKTTTAGPNCCPFSTDA